MSEPFFEIPMGEGSYELSRENTSLFRHLGAAAIYDHVFLTTGDNKGGYIWRTHSQYEEISELAEENLCVTHSNIWPPADIDVKNYIAHHSTDLEGFDGVPEEWVIENT